MAMDKEKKNLLVFGYGLAIIITIFVLRHGMKNGFHFASYLWLGSAGIIFFITLIHYQWLKPFYAKWMIGARFLGTIISTIIFSVLFYFVFGLTGIVLRLLRKDLLNQKWGPRVQTYWITREEKEFERDSYKKQF